MTSRGRKLREEMTLIDEWAEYLTATGASYSTVKIRTRTLHALMNHAETKDALALTRLDVIRFLGRGIAPWTRVTYWQGIRQWSEFLIDFGHATERDLLKGIPRPKTPDPVARPIDDDTVARLLAAPLSPRASAYVRLALYAGLRVHEIAKVRGEDFDLQSGWLMVHGKGGLTAPVPLHPELLKLAQSMPEFGFWFRSPGLENRSVSPIAVSQTIVSALRSVGCTATAHQLRDTAATRMQRKVKDIRVTQTLLRHRSIRSTQKYTGVADESMQTAILSLNWGDAA